MSHIDTLKVYEEYKLAGFSEETARHLTNVLENSFMTKINELKDDFASQKFNTILGGLIITLQIAVLGLLWNNNVDLQVLKTCGMQKIEEKLR